MQTDMHFYGTYAMARLAGIPKENAKIIAYATEFVDDSTKSDSETHKDGGVLHGIATAHHPVDTVVNRVIDKEEQRRVWVPFHFLPGGAGETLEEKLLCTKDSKIANEMFEHHINYCVSHFSDDQAFCFQLLGIAAHVYMDTFSHYGFSGISSEYNTINNDTLKLLNVQTKEMENYLLDKAKKFYEKYGVQKFAGYFSEKFSGGLGHAAVVTYPDRPFLKWKFSFEKERPGNGKVSFRDNPKTFMEGCKNLHKKLADFAKRYYVDSATQSFDKFGDEVERIILFQGSEEKRIEKWIEFFQNKNIDIFDKEDSDLRYCHDKWEDEKKRFHENSSSSEGIKTDVYKFHQAAAIHRWYVLKELLPKHGIAVY